MTELCGCGHERADHNHGTDSCRFGDCGCCEFITDVERWKDEKARWDWEGTEDERILHKLFLEEHAARETEREDNEPPSGSTDLGNRGGTTFCH